MPFGVYQRTEKIRRSISDALKGRHLSEEWKKKISQTLKGKKFSEDHKRKLRGKIPWNKGKHLSEESKRKIGKAIKRQWKEGKMKSSMLGKHHSEETKKKMSKVRLERKKRLGYINSPETRKKMSKAFKGRKLSEEIKRKLSKVLKGKKKPPFTEEHKRKISEGGKIPRPWMRGENSPRWKGGTSELSKRIKNSFKYKKWREAIFQRDNWTCQRCGKRGGIILHPHHKKSLASILEENNVKTLEDALNCEALWNINDGITLCRNCHKRTNTYGWNRYNEIFRERQEFKERKEFKIRKLELAKI